MYVYVLVCSYSTYLINDLFELFNLHISAIKERVTCNLNTYVPMTNANANNHFKCTGFTWL